MKPSSMRSLCAAALLLGGTAAAHATTINDPVGDFLPGYTGAHAGDLDVTSISVLLDGSDFVITGTMAAAIGTTSSAFYVWGVNRGAGTAGFAGIGQPGVLFDSVIVLRPTGASAVNLIGGVPASTPLNSSFITINGSSITARIATALLPSTGFALQNYGFNLWPRDSTQAGTAAISDFAPDNATVSVPEPASLALLLVGLAGAGLRRGNRTQRS